MKFVKSTKQFTKSGVSPLMYIVGLSPAILRITESSVCRGVLLDTIINFYSNLTGTMVLLFEPYS